MLFFLCTAQTAWPEVKQRLDIANDSVADVLDLPDEILRTLLRGYQRQNVHSDGLIRLTVEQAVQLLPSKVALAPHEYKHLAEFKVRLSKFGLRLPLTPYEVAQFKKTGGPIRLTYDSHVEALEFSAQTHLALRKMGIKSIRDLLILNRIDFLTGTDLDEISGAFQMFDQTLHTDFLEWAEKNDELIPDNTPLSRFITPSVVRRYTNRYPSFTVADFLALTDYRLFSINVETLTELQYQLPRFRAAILDRIVYEPNSKTQGTLQRIPVEQTTLSRRTKNALRRIDVRFIEDVTDLQSTLDRVTTLRGVGDSVHNELIRFFSTRIRSGNLCNQLLSPSDKPSGK